MTRPIRDRRTILTVRRCIGISICEKMQGSHEFRNFHNAPGAPLSRIVRHSVFPQHRAQKALSVRQLAAAFKNSPMSPFFKDALKSGSKLPKGMKAMPHFQC